MPQMGASMPSMRANTSQMGANTPQMGANTPQVGASMPPMRANTSQMGTNMPQMGTDMPGMNFGEKMENGMFPLGMAYVPMQNWSQPSPLEEGFNRGTMFSVLDLPFMMGRCR